MKIQKVIIKDFKIIEDLEKEINGSNIILLGENGVGKSTFIQAIEIGLGISKSVPPKSSGEISIITNEDGQEYQFKTVLADGKQKIEVIAPNGLRDTRKSTIGSLVGAIDFDIDEFVQLSNSKAGKKKQIEIVKSFLPQETKIELGKIETSIENAYSDRTEVNRNVKTLKGFIDELNISESDIDKYSLDIDTKEINEKLQKSIKFNTNIDLVQERFDNRAIDISEIEEEIEKLQKDLESKKNQQAEADKWLEENKKIDVSEFEKQIEESSNHNEMYNKVQDYLHKKDKLQEYEKEESEFTKIIEENRQLLSDTIMDSELPVNGLSFNEDSLTYNGLEVDETVISTSEIMDLGVQLKMAQNPNVNVILLQRGESLGNKKLKAIQSLCKEKGYQIIMEKVEAGTEELKIEIMPEL